LNPTIVHDTLNFLHYKANRISSLLNNSAKLVFCFQTTSHSYLQNCMVHFQALETKKETCEFLETDKTPLLIDLKKFVK